MSATPAAQAVIERGYTPEEYLAVLLSRQVRDGETAACGMVSPIPAAGLMLAGQTHAPRARIIVLESAEFDPFRRDGYSGSTEFHFMAQRGELDLFFVSGVQIDQKANINLHVVGDHDRPKMRFPGGYGTGMLYYMAKRVVLFRTEHTKRTLVPKVDFVTAAGVTPDRIYRPGGPAMLITTLAQFDWDKAAGRWSLRSVHPGHTADEVLANMGFAPAVSGNLAATPAPTADELFLLRTVVREKVAKVYPQFAEHSILAAV